MRRIMIFEREGQWRFVRPDGTEVKRASLLLAGFAAFDYGESLQGQALGYIIRWRHPPSSPLDESLTLHQRIF